jgi:APA family basic amino acid/polyamine antiporter
VAGRTAKRQSVRRARKSSSRHESGRVATYRRILVPLSDPQEPERVIDLACQLATEHASFTALSVIEVPMMIPMDAHMIEEETAAKRVLDVARAIAHSYGVSFSVRIVRARDAGEAIVQEAIRDNTEIIILSAPRKPRPSGRADLFGRKVQFVLKHSPCRVMVATSPADT